MSVTKVINIEVRDAELQGLENDLNKVGKQFDKVDSEAKKASTSIKDVGDNGGAIALLDELTGGLATKVRDAAEASKLFSFNLKAVRTALIATGIGAFVVALGVIVSYWDEITDFVNGVNRGLEIQNELLNTQISQLSGELSLLNAKEKLLIAEGKSTEEITQQKRKILILQQEQNKLLIDNLATQLERERTQIKEVTRWERIQIAALETFRLFDRAAQARAESILGNEEERTNLKQLQERLTAAQVRAEQLQLSLLNLDKPIATGTPVSTRTEEPTQQREQIESVVDPASSTEIQNAKLISDAKLEIVRNSAEQELAVEQYLNDQKLAITQQTLGAISNILGQNTAAGKAFGIAQALINTYQGVTQVLKSESTLPEPLATASKIANVATVLATGLQAVRQIKQVQVPGFSGAQGAAVSQGAPSFNVVGNSGVSQLAQTLQEDQNPVQAFVVSTAVTSQQELDNQIQQTATIG